MDNLTAIALLLSYWLSIGLLAQWCAKKALTIRTAFLLGAAACICIAGTVIGVSSIYHSQLMLVSNSIEITAFLFIGLALMGAGAVPIKSEEKNVQRMALSTYNNHRS